MSLGSLPSYLTGGPTRQTNFVAQGIGAEFLGGQFPLQDALSAPAIALGSDVAGNGSTTFNLPDLRGYFVRGAGTNSDGIASGTFAAKQAAAMLNHSHSGFTNATGDHQHSYTDASYFSSGLGGGGSPVPYSNYTAFTGVAGNHQHTVTTGNPSVGGGTETRPANIALLYCIKF